MNRFIAPSLIFCASVFVAEIAAPARAAISLANIANSAPFDRSLVAHIVGTSADGHDVDATLFMNSFDGGVGQLVGPYQPGNSISLFGSMHWADVVNRGLTVDATNYPSGTPPYIFPTLAPTGDGVHGTPINPTLVLDGTVLAPPAPADPTVQQTTTVLAPITYTDMDFMASMDDPWPFPHFGPPLLVDPLFAFDEAAGSGLAQLELVWFPNVGPSGAWEGRNVVYSFSSSFVPEPSSISLWAIAIAGVAWQTSVWGRRRGAASR